MKKTFLFTIISLLQITTSAQIIRTEPYLQNPTKNGMTISWITNVPTLSWVEYGMNRDQLEDRKDSIIDGQVACNNTIQRIRLTNLKPDQTYYYRVCSREMTVYKTDEKEFGKTAYSQVYSFKIPSPNTTDFTAIIFNDLHKHKDVFDALIKQVEGIKYDFVLFNGDCISDPADENDVVNFISYVNEKVSAEQRPVFYLRGNHELRNTYSIHLRNLIDYVGNKTYGAFNWGDTRFVMLDTGECDPDSSEIFCNLNRFDEMRMNEASFLKHEVGSNSFKKANKRILIHHIPIYGTEDNSRVCYNFWGEILKDAPFDLDLNGHTHRFFYYPKGMKKNNFPVVIGGGPSIDGATVMILQKKVEKMTLTVMNTKGEKLLRLQL